ncbi:hypothetical protein HJC23_001482 [Cyclotella cryptica]|uniref:Uncharacterized protein n=1 Tax=Cyclotella cryptica TaxID=29204 RepID=A0ABD3NVZ4_9STRA
MSFFDKSTSICKTSPVTPRSASSSWGPRHAVSDMPAKNSLIIPPSTLIVTVNTVAASTIRLRLFKVQPHKVQIPIIITK